MNLSENLKKIRKEHNLSQEQLAEKLGVSRQSVSKWESSQAYPEMDKMVQLCKIFNLNIDDLLNQDIKEINRNKQAKNNINKFIEDFLDFITTTIDMFGSFNFKTKIKCIFEQFIIVGILSLIYIIFGNLGHNIIHSLFSFVPNTVYYSIYHILEAVYLTICIIFTIVLLLHIFKTRYLDYYLNAKTEKSFKEEQIIENETPIITPKKELSTKPKEKIIIRNPNHSEYKFIISLLKCLLFIIKTIVAFIALAFCITLIVLAICFVILFLFIKTGGLFIGALITLISLITINIIILIMIYNFIIGQKAPKNILALIFICSLITMGGGIGLISINITDFKIINSVDNSNFINREKNLPMNNKIFFVDYNNKIEYIESTNQDIKIVYTSSIYYNLEIKQVDDGYYFYLSDNDSKQFELNKNIIQDINNKQIINYSNYKIYIYTTKENIKTLKTNLNKYYQS